MKRGERGRKNKKIYLFLVLFVFVLIFLVTIFIGLDSVENKSSLEGELDTLRWGSDGFEVALEKDTSGGVVLSLVSSQDWGEAINAIKPIFDAVNILIDKLAERGAPVNRGAFNIGYDLDSFPPTLNLNFGESIADTILKGVVLFLDQAEDRCDTEFVNETLKKIEDSEVHEVNLTGTTCNIFNLPGLLAMMDFADLYTVIMQTEDLQDLILEENKNAIAVINLDDHFEFEEECYFNASSGGDNLQFHIDSNNLLDIYPDLNWNGKEKVSVKLTCNETEIGDDFFVEVVDSNSSALVTVTGEGTTNGSNNPRVNESSEDEESGSDLEIFKILNPLPERYLIALSKGEEEIFSIDNEDYETIEWHFDGELTEEDSSLFKFEGLKEGKHIIKVRIRKGSLSDSNTWKVVVNDPLETPESPKSSGKKFVIYLIVFVILIIAGLLIALFFNRGKKVPKK